MKTISVLLLFCLELNFVEAQLGFRCTSSLQCGWGAFCETNTCRKDNCANNGQCQKGEECRTGLVNGRRKIACFKAGSKQIVKNTKEELCPGGGAIVMDFLGKIATCSYSKSCSAGQVCNPQNGFCCTKLRTCPKPSKVLMSQISGTPIMCQFKTENPIGCPAQGYCESKTGFCCLNVDTEKEIEKSKPIEPIDKPWRGEVCIPNIGCSGNAACICGQRGLCRCECPSEFCYSVSTDGRTCQRTRRRLKEKCKSDMECSAAFSECATGGCRCKTGFQRDGDGGCKPIAYKCAGGGAPLSQNDKMVTCHLRSTLKFGSRKGSKGNSTDETENMEVYSPEGSSSVGDWWSNLTAWFMPTVSNYVNDYFSVNATMFDWTPNERDSCPEDHYCVPMFDDALRPGYYQGFCCASPSDIKPTCPVGVAHESSFPPDFGCRNCPTDYFCHRDGVATEKEICCPKPCVSLEDIYHDGQCYPIAFFGDSCHISAQCTQTRRDAVDEYSEVEKLECQKGVCSCPAGFNYADGQCKRIMCTVGMRGEPSVDPQGGLIRCSRSSDCSQGHMCDPNTSVCCKGTNRCPKEFVETGELCTENNSCRSAGDMCYRTKNGKVKVCCTPDDQIMKTEQITAILL